MIERGGLKPDFKRLLAKKSWDYLINNLGLEFSSGSQSNLLRLNELLKTNSAVVYINHTEKMDAPIAISMVLNYLTNAKNILGPVGMKHYDWTRDPVSAALFRILPSLGVQPEPIVQVGDEKNYGAKKQLMIENLKEQTSIMMKKASSVYGIAPEGKRNKKDGALQKANKGMGFLEKYSDLYYLPVAIIYKKYSSKPEVIVGKPLLFDEIIPDISNLSYDPKERAQEITDIHMKRLAEIMPKKQRGYYGQNL